MRPRPPASTARIGLHAQRSVAAPIRRFGAVYVGMGMDMKTWAQPADGTLMVNPIVQPLEAIRDRVLVVTGLDSKPALSFDAGQHPRAQAAWLTRVSCTQDRRPRPSPWRVAGSDHREGVRERYSARLDRARHGADGSRGELWLRIQLRVQQHRCLEDADHTASRRKQSPQRLRAAVRRERDDARQCGCGSSDCRRASSMHRAVLPPTPAALPEVGDCIPAALGLDSAESLNNWRSSVSGGGSACTGPRHSLEGVADG